MTAAIASTTPGGTGGGLHLVELNGDRARVLIDLERHIAHHRLELDSESNIVRGQVLGLVAARQDEHRRGGSSEVGLWLLALLQLGKVHA